MSQEYCGQTSFTFILQNPSSYPRKAAAYARADLLLQKISQVAAGFALLYTPPIACKLRLTTQELRVP